MRILFNHFISENFALFTEAGYLDVDYATTPEEYFNAEFIDDAVKTKGYYIAPSQLLSTMVEKARQAERDNYEHATLNADLKAIFTAIETSATGYPIESDIKGLFDDIDVTSNSLGIEISRT